MRWVCGEGDGEEDNDKTGQGAGGEKWDEKGSSQVAEGNYMGGQA